MEWARDTEERLSTRISVLGREGRVGETEAAFEEVMTEKLPPLVYTESEKST